MKKRRILFLWMIALSLSIAAQKIKPFYGPFPFPNPNKHMLFYLQRTVDRNTLIYELNYDSDGEINLKKPVKIYWIDFEEGGKISPLTFAQNKFAYGLESELIDKTKRIFQLHLVSYKRIKLYLKPTGKNKAYQTHVTIKGKAAVLTKLFVHISGGTYFNPTVSYIELVGEEISSGQLISERVKPEKD